MSQFQRNFLTDSSAVNPTIRPIDTYYQAAQAGVAGAPIGPNPATQIAAALGQFNESLNQYYFQPQHEQWKRQAEVDAQTYKDRYDNFQAFDKAVKNGEIHQGDNPWLQVYTKELYAKDAANELSIRIAGLSDQQDILGAEDPTLAFNQAVAELQGEILGDVADPYMNQAFQRFSEPVIARGANQFAQGLRRHNINAAMSALEKDINNALNEKLGGFATADDNARIEMLSDFSAAFSALSVESNLLTKQQVNATLGKAVLGHVESLIDEHPRTAANLLEMLDGLETSPGSYLTDSTAFNLQVTRLEEKIADELVRDSDRVVSEERNRRYLASNELSAKINKHLNGVSDYKAYRDSDEAEAFASSLVAEYGEDVDSPAEYFLRRLDTLASRQDSRTSESVREDLAQVMKDLNSGQITPEAALAWAEATTDLSASDFLQLERQADAVRSDGLELDPWTREQMEYGLTARAEELLQAFGDEVVDQSGMVRLARGAEYEAMNATVRRDLQIALSDLELSEEFQGLTSNREKADAVRTVVDEVFERHLPKPEDQPKSQLPNTVDPLTQRILVGSTASARATQRRMEAELAAQMNTDPSKQEKLDRAVQKSIAKEQDLHRSIRERLRLSLSTETVRLDRNNSIERFIGSLSQVKKDLKEISLTSRNGPSAVREYYYSITKLAEENPKVYERVLKGLNPAEMLMVDSPEHANREYELYLKMKDNPDLLHEEVVVTGGFAIKPNQKNLFYMIEQATGWDLSDRNNPKFKALEQAWARQLVPPNQNQ